jgi:hypothetical protein
MRRLGLLVLAAGAVALASGCTVVHEKPRERADVGVDGPEPRGYIAVGHCTHNDRCGHYWYNGSWYFDRGHYHTAGCGHYRHHGRWILAGTVVVGNGHVCDDNCNHYFHEGNWYVMRSHRHGPGCGHARRGGIWVGIGF